MAKRQNDSHNTEPKAFASEVFELAPVADLKDVMRITDLDILIQKTNDIVGLLWLPPTLTETEKNARIIKATELFESLAPNDGVEAMLALQMVGTHAAAMECLRRAMIPKQLLPATESNLRSAQKLMALYTRQMEALNRHRGKGQQKVTVEYVNVEPGAQAIVGSVETSRSPSPARSHQRGNSTSEIEGTALEMSNLHPVKPRRAKASRK
jgi:hypothetical protein